MWLRTCSREVWLTVVSTRRNGAQASRQSVPYTSRCVGELRRSCAAAGLRLSKLAAQSRKSKKKKEKKDKEKKGKKARSEGTVLHVAAPARGRPQGRYTKREAGKMVKGYSQEDLSMILGVAPADFVAPTAVGAAAPCQEPEARDKPRKKRRRDRSPSQPPAAEVEAAEPEEDEPEPWTPPAPDWWGASMFRWAGRLGGIRRSSKHDKGFCEDDQVAAYNAVHDGATHGKQGLGVRDAPKKVAGARWAGEKKRFGDESAEDEPVPEPAADTEADMRKIKWKAQRPPRPGIPSTHSSLTHAEQKLAEAALRALPGGSATLSALRRSVLATAGIGDSKDAREALSRCAWRYA